MQLNFDKRWTESYRSLDFPFDSRHTDTITKKVSI